MDFLSKIKKHFGNKKNSSFRKSVQEEKKQKYLFRDDEVGKYQSSRGGSFARQKKAIAPFTSSIFQATHMWKSKIQESYVLAYIGGFLLVLSAYIVVFSPYFKVSPSQVLLESTSPGVDISIAYRSIEEIYGKSLFLLDEKDVALTIQKSLKNIAKITIDKLYPNGVKILLTGAPIRYSAKIAGNEKEWYMSENGVLVPKEGITSTGGLTHMTVVSEALRSEIFLDYKQVINETNIFLIARIVGLFSGEWPDIGIEKLFYFEKENELHIQTKKGSLIILSLEEEKNQTDPAVKLESVKNQLLGLKSYIDQNKKVLLEGGLAYIDARIVKKLFVCRDKGVCKNNLIMIYGEAYRDIF